MTREPRPGSPLAAGIVTLVVTSAYYLCWQVVVERRPPCQQTGVFACSGPALMLILLGVPATYLVWSLALRAVRAPLPWLAPLMVMGVLFVLVPMSEVVEPPTWVWPAVVGALTGLWARLLRPRVSPTAPAGRS